jgi:hypothetical protein
LSSGLTLGLTVGLSSGLPGGLVAGLAVGLADVFVADPADVLSPQQVWRSSTMIDLLAALVVGFFGPIFGLVIGLAFGPTDSGLAAAAVFGLALGWVLGLTGWLTSWFTGLDGGRVGIFQVYLHIRYRTPLRLMRFLEDARARHLLRTVGPVFQFRHALLQDRLASVPRQPTAGDMSTP